MKSSIVLFYPKTGFDVKDVSIDLPLSVLAVASTLVQDYEVKIIDQRIDENWGATLQEELNKDPLFVGISAMTGSQIKFGLEASRLVKEGDTSIPVIWGGIHPTLLPEQTVRHAFVDIAVIGEGEATIRDLASALKARRNLDNIKNIVYKKNGEVVRTPLSGFLDMNELPRLPYELVDVEQYIKAQPKALPGAKRMLPFLTSRGCPYTCSFCCNPRVSRGKWRSMTAENAYEEVMNLVETYQLDSVAFYDEAFMTDRKRAEKMAEMIHGEVRWFIQGRMDELARADLAKYERNGLGAVQPGLETGSSRILKLIKKRETIEDFLCANRALGKTNIIAYYNFMMGFPTETYDELMQSIDLALRLLRENPKSRLAAFYVLTPYPGTELFDVAVNLGFKAPTSLAGWANYSRQHLMTPWVQDKIEMLRTIMLTSKVIDGHAIEALFETPPLLFSFVGLLAKKWYQYKWRKRSFRKTIDVKLLDYISRDYLKLEF